MPRRAAGKPHDHRANIIDVSTKQLRIMDLEAVKNAIVKNVYHIDANKKVPLHKHGKNDEVFYCIAGSGYGVFEDREVELTHGKAFIVPAGVMHSLRTDTNLYVASFLIPVVEQ